jgi:predicted amidophosphoribosyltransferase
MCRFTGKEDPGYEIVASFLQRLCREIESQILEQIRVSKTAEEQKFKEKEACKETTRRAKLVLNKPLSRILLKHYLSS